MSSAGLSKDDQTELQSFLEGEQAKARVQSSIQNFTELCFDKCITGGISSSFSRKEEQCLSNCVERFLDTSIFLVNRLQQQQQQQQHL